MKRNIFYFLPIALLAACATSCSNEPEISENGKQKMEFCFNHPDATRVTETSFEKDDMVGVFVTETDKPLEIAGNVVTNEKLLYNGSSWSPSRPLYWNDGTFNVFAYYPYRGDVNSIADLEFEVQTDQRDSSNGEMSAYEASDFLFTKTVGVEASSNPVALQFKHILSKITVNLVKGADFEGDFPENATVAIHNTVTNATVDLEAGVATKDAYGDKKTIFARQLSASSYTAIVIPQRLDSRVPFVEVTMEGVSYLLETRFQFKPGMHHIINVVIDSNPDKVKIEIGGEISKWN